MQPTYRLYKYHLELYPNNQNKGQINAVGPGQCISPQKLNFSASDDFGFFTKATTNRHGARPKSVNRITPCIKKLSKGEFFSIRKGIPINLPLGETINKAPPPMAPKPRNSKRIIRIFLAVFDLIIGFSKPVNGEYQNDYYYCVN